MKVVVAGGSGLIGRAIVDRLARRGDDVVVLTRGRHVSTDTRVVRWNPPTIGDWVVEVERSDVVVNATGLSVGGWWWTDRRRRQLRASRLEPTRALVDAVRMVRPSERPRVLLNLSGTDVYEGRDAEPAGESTAPAESFLSRLVLDWEAAARDACAVGLRVVLLRTSLVLAPCAPALRLLCLPVRLGLGGSLGSGCQWVSWVHVDDVVGLALLAIDDPRISGPLNASAPDPRRQAAFAAALGSVLGRPAGLRMPARAIRLVAGDMSVLALGSRRVWPQAALSLGYRFEAPRLEPALRRVLRPAPG